jgi:hypothetical protein
MADFPLQVWENLVNTTLDFYLDKPEVHKQSVMKKPLLDWLRGKEKAFPGGKEFLSVRVQGEFGNYLEGWAGDSTVTYENPAYVKTAVYPYKRLHGGISFTADELIRNGISILDTTTGQGDTVHSKAEMLQLTNLLENKVMSMTEGMDINFNDMYWDDGSTDPMIIPGIQSFIVDDPNAAIIVGGIDQSAPDNWWWKNRANLNITIGTDPKQQNLINFLDAEVLQLSKYQARPDTAFCGSDFLGELRKEFRANGYYSQTGFARGGDVSIGDLDYNGIVFTYDPTLDRLGMPKRCYLLDSKHIRPLFVQGEKMKRHHPARPPEKYVYYRAITYVGGLVCDQRNSSGVYAFA